jgi:general secretion pathway protein J
MKTRGFTLVELLVALSVMALLALLSWQGVDSMTRTQSQITQRQEANGVLRSSLAQWKTDLDASVSKAPNLPSQAGPMDWNGLVFRLVRHAPPGAAPGWRVVAWARMEVGGVAHWARWQSAPLIDQTSLQQAWQQAERWAQNSGNDPQALSLLPAEQMQLFYARDGAWVNPLSSGNTNAPSTSNTSNPVSPASTAPEGVRLILNLPSDVQGGGRIISDWAQPTLTGGKS